MVMESHGGYSSFHSAGPRTQGDWFHVANHEMLE